MPGDLNSEYKLAGESGKHSQSHAEKIRNPTKARTILDIRVLSETTGTKVIILTEDSHGKLTKMQGNPVTTPVSQNSRGLKPEASEEEVALETNRLQSVEADAILRHSGQWEPFVKRKEWTEAIRGGDWYMAEGAAPKSHGEKDCREQRGAQ
ncbi:hypothetical protein SRHO_G00256430 [Serrasalmus rhombeus]